MGRPKKKVVDESKTLDDEPCYLCGSHELKAPKKNKSANATGVKWFCCDCCLSWVHTVCAKIPDDVYEHHQNNKTSKYLCEKCSYKGTFVECSSNPSLDSEMILQVNSKIIELEKQVTALQAETAKYAKTSKSSLSRLHKKVETFAANTLEDEACKTRLKELDLHTKTLEKGAVLAESEQKRNNANRIVISKVPYVPGENLKSVLCNIWSSHKVTWNDDSIVNYYRVNTTSSKDFAPHIIVVFSSMEKRRLFLNAYFKSFKGASLKGAKVCDSNHRYIINEVLSYKNFVIRNLALRYKKQGIIAKIFVRNGNVFIRRTGSRFLVPVSCTNDVEQLVQGELNEEMIDELSQAPHGKQAFADSDSLNNNTTIGSNAFYDAQSDTSLIEVSDVTVTPGLQDLLDHQN